jgi:peptidoglycan/LPS O-acetylase OafA/YrhL
MPQEWSDLFFADRNFEFMIGYLVGVVLRHDWISEMQARVSLWLGLAALVAGTALLNLGWDPLWRVPVIGIPVALFILGLASLEIRKTDDRIVKVLTTPKLVWLGGTSYVLYLSHAIFFHLWSLVLPVERIWVLPMTIGAILAAALGYRYWENPILSYAKSMRQSTKKTSNMQAGEHSSG